MVQQVLKFSTASGTSTRTAFDKVLQSIRIPVDLAGQVGSSQLLNLVRVPVPSYSCTKFSTVQYLNLGTVFEKRRESRGLSGEKMVQVPKFSYEYLHVGT